MKNISNSITRRWKLTTKNFPNAKEKAEIGQAVMEAESKTSGEIMVSVVGKCWEKGSGLAPEQAVYQRALDKFADLGIQQTEGRTGLLIMLSLYERMVVILADKGINDLVEPGTWEKSRQTIIAGMKTKTPAEGICNAVRNEMGPILAEHFPIQPGDKNELDNAVVVEE